MKINLESEDRNAQMQMHSSKDSGNNPVKVVRILDDAYQQRKSQSGSKAV